MDLINTAAAPCLLLPFLLSGAKLMLYWLQRAQPDFPSRVTLCQHVTGLPAWWQWTSVSAQSLRQQPPAARTGGNRPCFWCWAFSMVPLPKALLRSIRNFLQLHIVLTVKYSERKLPKSRVEIMDAVVALSDNAWFFYLCSFYGNLPHSTSSEKPVAMKLLAEIWNFS